MSRSRPTSGSANPAVRTLEWKGGAGHWRYWDKAASAVVTQDAIRFAVLDELSSISGFAESYGNSGYSNEVHSTKREPLEVKVFTGKGQTKTVATGLYDDIKGDIPAGLKYTKVIYALDLDTKETVRLLLTGAALSAWIDSEIDKRGGIVQDGVTEGKKGAVKYKMPVFREAEMEDGDEALALEADKVLQAYLDAKAGGGKPAAAADDDPPAEPVPVDDYDGDAPIDDAPPF